MHNITPTYVMHPFAVVLSYFVTRLYSQQNLTVFLDLNASQFISNFHT